MNTAAHSLVFIGAPMDAGASYRGCSMGPEALRVANLSQNLNALGYTVHDSGNLHGPVEYKDSSGPYKNLESVAEWSERVFDAVHQVLSQQQGIPVLLGGDHSVAIGSISAVAQHCKTQGKKLRVLWFDAHADFNTPELSPSGNLHGMPMACLCGLGPASLTHLSGQSPAIDAACIRQIGIRSVDAGERKLVHDVGLEIFDMRHIDEQGMRATMTSALKGVDDNTHLHVSFDVDFLDPGIAPGVGTAVPGGPTYREAQLCMEMIADTGLLGSLDIVELNPAFDERNKTAHLVTDLMGSLFGKSTLLKKN